LARERRCGHWTIEERIHGWQADPVRAVAIYHVAHGLIDNVRLIDG
jgi:hypothetical protein